MSKEQVFQFFENVYQWSSERKIIDPSRTLKQQEVVYDGQVQKLIEELNETFQAIRVKDTDAIKDGIGDVAVTMVNVVANALLIGQHFAKDKSLPIEAALADIADDNSTAYESVADKPLGEGYDFSCSELARVLLDPTYYKDFIGLLYLFAYYRGQSLTECLDVAWNQIKDRKGYLSDEGIFIKESV